MKFCAHCGQTLSILDSTSAVLCETCSTEKKRPVTAENIGAEPDSELKGALLSAENGKIVLKSKEGWLLWSGRADKLHSFETIHKNAIRILKIRKKRKG